MKESTSKEKILKIIRSAYQDSATTPYPDSVSQQLCFKKNEELLDVLFARNFSENGGQFVYCEDEEDFISQLREFVDKEGWESIFCIDPNFQTVLMDCDIPFSTDLSDENVSTGITGCELLIASTGSVLVSSNHLSGRKLNIFPEKHVVFAFADQLVSDISDAIDSMNEKYKTDGLPSSISMISGVSTTSDIENIFVTGAHGPKEIVLFYIE